MWYYLFYISNRKGNKGKEVYYRELSNEKSAIILQQIYEYEFGYICWIVRGEHVS